MKKNALLIESKKTKILLSCMIILVLTALGGTLFLSIRKANPPDSEKGEEVFLISTREDFEEFAHRVKNGENSLDGRLTQDIYFNDPSEWESWEESPPKNADCIATSYHGVFDGDGYALVGFYSDQYPIFFGLMEDGGIRNLNLRSCLFVSRYDSWEVEKEDPEVDLFVTAALCGYNGGRIENCSVEGSVLGDGTAAGLVVYNGGIIENCSFSGKITAGECIRREEEELAINCPLWRAGGIAAINYSDGLIKGCSYYGETILYTDGLKIWKDTGDYQDDILMESCVGGIAGKNNGIVEKCINEGKVSCPRVAGGIAGANSGEIRDCKNKGDIWLLPEEAEIIRLRYYEDEERVAAGISGYNTGRILNCAHEGKTGKETDKDPGYVFGIAMSSGYFLCQPGEVKNCYYLSEGTDQKYRYSGTYGLSEEEMKEIDVYLYGEKALQDVEGFQELYAEMNIPGTDQGDYIKLSMGPEKDEIYQVKPGDSLWRIAENYYGDGSFYESLQVTDDKGNRSLIYPGEEILVPRLEYYLLRALDERDFCICEVKEKDGAVSQQPAFAKKESAGFLGIYYGIDTVGEEGLEVLSKSQEECDTWLMDGVEPAIFSSCIFYEVTENELGDFFAEDWKGVQKSITTSAEKYLGDQYWGLRFYRYQLENGENLYGYSFKCQAYQPGEEEKQVIDCCAFYRMRQGLLGEFIGVEKHREDSDLLNAVRYLGASVDQEIEITEYPYGTDYSYLGREGWAFDCLHNPFALVTSQRKRDLLDEE